MSSAQRRLVASLILIAFLGFWVWGAATIGSMLATAPKCMSLVFFVIAGLGWVFPLRPVFKWMTSAPDREDDPL